MVEHRLFEYEPNKPIGFFLHSSIRTKFQRYNLTSKIIAYGGKVLDSPSGADTVLVDETKIRSVQYEQLHYSLSRDEKILSIVVEPMNFIHKCINTGKFVHGFPERFGMGGRAPGSSKRVEFTDDDDDHLCWYISRRIPNLLDGGRLSKGLYNELEQLGEEDPDHAWARRHPSSSWLERYKKNRPRLDPIIQKYAEEYPPPRSALYSLSRRANKKNKLLIAAKVIQITDESEDDSSPEELYYSRPLKPPKRARIDTNSPFPAEELASVEAERHPSYSRDSPDLALHAFEQQTPAPSPTLVNKRSQRFDEPASNRAVDSSILSRPSTSFRDVIHSSPVLHSGLPGGEDKSNNTSRTEPSSRSLAILSGLSHPPQTTTNYPAESSILRESAHKRSSPIPAPVRKAARRPKFPTQPPPSPPSNDTEYGSMWAPYKNTRSRSRSVEPAPLHTTRKKSGRGRKDPIQRNDVPLAPVLEGEVEHEHREGGEEERGAIKQIAESKEKSRQVRTTLLTETMQEEYDVEGLLMNQSSGAISGAVSETWKREVEEQVDDVEETHRSKDRSERRRQPLFALDSDDDAIDQMIMPPPLGKKSFTAADKGKGNGRTSVKEESEGEDPVLSEARPYNQVWRRSSFDDNDDNEIDRISSDHEGNPYTLEELMASSSPQQTLRFTSRPSGSPLQVRDQNRRATIPFSTPANPTKWIRTRQLAGPKPTSLTPSSIGTLPEVPYVLTTQFPQSSPARVPSSSKRLQAPSTSKSHRTRHGSLASIDSEVPFPLTGTKASSVKAILERDLKESPYAPPSGTKAAAIMASKHKSRSRKQRG